MTMTVMMMMRQTDLEGFVHAEILRGAGNAMHGHDVSIVKTAALETLFVVRRYYLVGTPQDKALLVDGDPGSVIDLVFE